MEAQGVKDQDTLIDLESGNNVVIGEYNPGMDVNFAVGLGRILPNSVLTGGMCTKDDRNQHMDGSPPSPEAAARNGDDRKSEGEEKLGLLDNSGGEKAKKKWSKKPPRPPRPPTHLPLDASDQKLLNELNELALLKRARIERMKALKKMKNAKQGSSTSNFCPMIITIIFCLVILWQGFCSRQESGVSFHGSPESSVRAHSSLISIHFYKKNHSNIRPHSSTSAAPNNAEAHHRGWRSVAKGERLRHEHIVRA
ncbi:uncharacterized protein LOC100840620 [Brachypodium distachyon]|uniref:Uncharacterized protein n=2 Tax=Brachypodium distachyon TaxID=15368 RepID=I1HMQ8_BRADI|nr:uncharacterized protein LOC100840620 [Brachypodium distachyon]XP_010231821.1 uncharacterized protein LOC100840620 [Brachypodium distachyon]XP_010231822.1 uncharacterized protein LOC100840620 [Brachypodium distachyon]XP_014754218.1 uncharacterized protein LOC100840620 [Brachypodium distachyon]XP_024314356.1 uncharacterized protein LOC100840620 [Brachypodium distachyon]KQK07926.1 hypothetical protein BRADI_2g38470v3 [Brachypodium distachyon]KQK07928.1 hypothetical protein BRADI_2g38470v3 [Br|eukprot:XP_003569067.1 uncharacterized protein LOC100840620 [Brachypodium distachyon]